MKRAKSKPAQPAAANPTSTSDKLRRNVPSEQTPALSPFKRWSFRVIVFLVFPVLLLGLTEAALRIGGYGYPASFFIRARIHNEEYLIENEKFGLRFFPPQLARSPSPILIPAKKGAGTCRIFLFGESAAQGDPRPAYGAGRYLQALLRERFADRKFEVICVATAAINSHVIVPIARECARYEGDVWIVYMGNNEMVGPFGAATVFGSRAPEWQVVRLGLAVQRTRLGQLMMNLARKLSGHSAGRSSWGGMKMFQQNQLAPDDSRKEVVYRNFRKNLEDILKAGVGSGARVILSTVAVNLRDCAPFASTGAEVTNSTAFKDGMAAEGREDWAAAEQDFEAAARAAPDCAELQLRWAQCLLHITNTAAALDHFQAACDADALPFRADSRINSIIRKSAANEGRETNRFAFFDAAGMFAASSPAKIPGEEAFYEHVHFNFDGNYRLARAWAGQVATLLGGSAEISPASSPVGSQAAAKTRAVPGNQAGGTPALPSKAAGETPALPGNEQSWASQEVCERDLALTDWNRVSVLQDILQRLNQPPFTGKLDHEECVKKVRAQIRELREHMDDTARQRAREIYNEDLRRWPEDHRLHENFAEYLELTGDLPQAVTEWRQVAEIIPHHHVAWFQAGRLLLRQGNLKDAEPMLSKALSLRPDLAEGWLELGKLHALEGRPEVALADYERERKLVPEDYRVYYHIGKALSGLHRRAEAIDHLRQAVRLNPDFWEGQYALGEELGFDGQLAEARSQFERVLRARPDYAMAHLNLGVTLVKQGDVEGAIQQFEETKRLDPANKLVDQYLQQVSRGRSQTQAKP